MKVTIDIESKTVEISGVVKLVDVVDTLKELFPKGEWKKFSITSKVEQLPVEVPVYIGGSAKPWWETQPTVMISDNSGEFLYK